MSAETAEPLPERMIDAGEAAKVLNCHPRTLKRMAERCEVPAMRVGNRWRFLPSVLDQWHQQRLMANCRKATE